jgi:hypothetical protein
MDRSFDQVRVAAPLRPLPLIILSADRPWGPQIPSLIAAGTLSANVPPDFGYVTDAAQKEAQEKLAKLVPNAKHITNTNSGPRDTQRAASTRDQLDSPGCRRGAHRELACGAPKAALAVVDGTSTVTSPRQYYIRTHMAFRA